MIDVNYGDKIVLRDGEVGVCAGFPGRGRNAVMVRLKPAANGNGRMRVVRSRDIAAIERNQD